MAPRRESIDEGALTLHLFHVASDEACSPSLPRIAHRPEISPGLLVRGQEAAGRPGHLRHAPAAHQVLPARDLGERERARGDGVGLASQNVGVSKGAPLVAQHVLGRVRHREVSPGPSKQRGREPPAPVLGQHVHVRHDRLPAPLDDLQHRNGSLAVLHHIPMRPMRARIASDAILARAAHLLGPDRWQRAGCTEVVGERVHHFSMATTALIPVSSPSGMLRNQPLRMAAGSFWRKRR